jgi:hypothetical protein
MDGITSLYKRYLNELENPVTTGSNVLYGIPSIMPQGGYENTNNFNPSTRYTNYSQGPLTNKQLSLLSAVNPMFGIVGYGQKLADQGVFNRFGRFGQGLTNFLESPASKFSRLYNPFASITGGGFQDRMGIAPGSFAESMAMAESFDGGFDDSGGPDSSETGMDSDGGYGGGVTGGGFGE